jgi:hypothetical protein
LIYCADAFGVNSLGVFEISGNVANRWFWEQDNDLDEETFMILLLTSRVFEFAKCIQPYKTTAFIVWIT